MKNTGGKKSPNYLKHVYNTFQSWYTMVIVPYQISQRVHLPQEIQADTADNLGDRAPGTKGDSAENITARKATSHTQIHTRSGGRQQSPCHFRLQATHVGPATPHTKLSEPRPPWCPTAATEGLPESYFSSTEQTQKSVCLKKKERKKKKGSHVEIMPKHILMLWLVIWPCNRNMNWVSVDLIQQNWYHFESIWTSSKDGSLWSWSNLWF